MSTAKAQPQTIPISSVDAPSMDGRTVLATVCTDEKTRQQLWQYTEKHTLLVNELLEKVAEHPNFQQWQRKGKVTREAVDKILTPLKSHSCYQGLPHRFFVSASLTVTYCYQSWLAQQKQRYLSLTGKTRWLDVVKSDVELAAEHDCSQEAIRAKAEEILGQVQQQQAADVLKKNEKQRKRGNHNPRTTQAQKTIFNLLFKQYDSTTEPLTKRAIVYLLKHNLQLGEQEENPEDFARRLLKKQIEIERLEQQLKSRLPKGRDPTGARFKREIELAIALPPTDGEGSNYEAEFQSWLEQKQIRLFNSSHYPIVFGSSDDLYWSKPQEVKVDAGVDGADCKEARSELQARPAPATGKKRRSRSRTKHRRKQSQQRLYVRFQGMAQHVFEVYCDRRQLPYFRLLESDWQTHKELSKQEKFGIGLFLLRSAALLWVEDPELYKRVKKQQSWDSSTAETPGSARDRQQLEPWNTHRLYLHCTIDINLLSAQGIEQVRQQKIARARKSLETANNKEAQSAAQLPTTATQATRVVDELE